MRRFTLWALTLCGVGLIVCGVGLLLLPMSSAQAQEEEGATPTPTETTVTAVDLSQAEFIGSKDCSDCHKSVVRDHNESAHVLTLVDTGGKASKVLGSFDQGADVRTVTFPGETAPRPFEAKDIAFAVGSGRNVQRYVYEVEKRVYSVFPAQWNVTAQAWEPYTLDAQWPSEAYNFTTQCAGCHTTGLDIEKGKWEDDGVSCESCHGPGSLHQTAAKKQKDNPDAIHAAIVLTPNSQVCARCHSTGTEPSQNLPFPLAYQPGVSDLLSPDVYTLVMPDDSAHWSASGHAITQNMQFNETQLSAHTTSLETLKGSDAAADACLSCHSADSRWSQYLIARSEAGDRDGTVASAATLETAQFGITCVTCHNPHSTGEFPALLVNEPNALCAECHTNPADSTSVHHPSKEMFEGVTMVSNVEGIAGAHFSVEDGPRCTTCHMPDVTTLNSGDRASHRFTPILPNSDAAVQDSCTRCHKEIVDVAGMAQLVSDVQGSTVARLAAARAALKDDTPEWVKAALDFVEGDGSKGIHNYAYASALLSAVETQLGFVTLNTTQNVQTLLTNRLTALGVQAQPTAIPTTTTTITATTGLTAGSWVLLSIFGLILLIAAYAFFVRRPR